MPALAEWELQAHNTATASANDGDRRGPQPRHAIVSAWKRRSFGSSYSRRQSSHTLACRSTRVTFEDDGWGRCEDCGNTFRWRGPFGVWERLKAILIP